MRINDGASKMRPWRITSGMFVLPILLVFYLSMGEASAAHEEQTAMPINQASSASSEIGSLVLSDKKEMTSEGKNLTDRERSFVDDLGVKFPDATAEERYRFLRAKGWNLKHASSQLKAFLEWRRTHDLDNHLAQVHVSPQNENEDDAVWIYACTVAASKTKELVNVHEIPRLVHLHRDESGRIIRNRNGAPLVYFLLFKIDPNVAPLDVYASALAVFLDKQIPRDSLEEVSVLLDVRLGHQGWPNPKPYSLLPFFRQLAGLMMTNFPERLHSCVIYPMPRAAQWIWKMIKYFLDPDTASKMSLIAGSARSDAPPPHTELAEHLEDEILHMLEKRRKSEFECRVAA